MAPNDNQILHAALLSGNLSVEVVDVDIRRSGSDAGLAISPIETDYILRIKSTKRSERANELQTHHCSKRYLDVRNLAYALHSYAVEVVKYHAKKSGGGGSSIKVPRKLIRFIEKPIEILQYTTNTESNYSDLAGELDDVLRHSNEERIKRRTSKLLDKCAPLNVRDVLEAVDEFYESILSEKRQFGLKSNFAHVEKVALRRKTLMNEAFSNFVTSLHRAGICNDLLPPVLDELIFGFEYFLLTDVVVDQDPNARSLGNDLVRAPQAVEDACPISPKTVRRRASLEDREKEQGDLRCSTKELMIDDEEPVGRTMNRYGVLTTKSLVERENLLPESAVGFSVLVGVGATCFKLLGNRTISIQLDFLVLLMLSCSLIGYHMAPEGAFIAKDASSSQAAQGSKLTRSRERPNLAAFRASENNAGAHNLIQASFRRLSAAILTPPKAKVVLETFEKFPEGAAIGSHFNCWSIPAATNFHVRGADYLTDKKKIPSSDFLLPCRGCDLFLTDNPPLNIGRNSSILAGTVRDVPTFIINYRLPWGVFVTYHEIPEKFLPFLRRNYGYGDTSQPLPSQSDMSAGERCVCNFFLSDTDEKNAVWKIVPLVVEGPWVVKRVVGGKPAIVGKSLPITYTYQPPQPELGFAEYLEADLDIVSSAAARNILAVVRSSVQVLTIDLGFVIQGNTKEELPEQMMAGLRLHGLDPLNAEALPQFHDEDLFEIQSTDSD
jgi:hypothetical protein